MYLAHSQSTGTAAPARDQKLRRLQISGSTKGSNVPRLPRLIRVEASNTNTAGRVHQLQASPALIIINAGDGCKRVASIFTVPETPERAPL
jgi:hypothetical protein